jgi:hypothetical protein
MTTVFSLIVKKKVLQGYASSYTATQPSIGRDATSTGRGPILIVG